MKHDLTAILDQAEVKYRLSHISTDIEARKTACVPFGLLGLDTLLGGGLFPGLWYTVYGGEGSAKSTTLATGIASFAQYGCFGNMYDFEGSSSPLYLGNILEAIYKLRGGKQLTAAQIFGVKDKKGKWAKTPIFRLYTEGIGDTMFNALASVARQMPDKVYESGKWYYVFEDKPANAKIVQALSSRGSYYVEADNGYPELIIIADSYPMMFPDRLDEDDKGAGMAAVARMFSENVPKIMGRLKRKAITVIGANQLRLRPGVTHGNPEYEPGGTTVQFASSVRIKNSHMSVPHGKGRIEEEPSVLTDGNDQYKYVKMQVTKNKSNTSVGLETWQRVWAADPESNAYGFDPVWNIYDYLTLTGQAERFGSGKKRPINLQLWSIAGDEEVFAREMDFMDLKALILLPEEERMKYAKEMKLDKKAYMNYFTGHKLYEHLAAQVHEGTGLTFAYNLLNGGEIGVDETEEEGV